jgi:hypothetical protein
MTPPSTWKKVELKIASYIPGAKRRGADYGGKSGGKNDLIIDGQYANLSVEIKHNQAPTWGLFCKALDQARAANSENGVPIVVVHKAGDRIDNSLVLMRLSDFSKLLNLHLEEKNDNN